MAANDERLQPITRFIAALSYGARKVRQLLSTDSGYLVAGHAQVDGVAFNPELIRDILPHDGVEVDIREMDKTLFTLKSTLDQALTVSYFGLIASSGDEYLISSRVLPIGTAPPTLRFNAVTDPWKFILIRAQATIAPLAGSFSATFEEET